MITTPTQTTTKPQSSKSSHSQQQQACAACKYQRRKCGPECALAPYFPHERQRQFMNAHRLFGVSNITKIIRALDDPRARDHAMRSIIFQSDARASDPVGGCYRIVRDLQIQLDLATAYLHSLTHHLSLLRASSSSNSAASSATNNNHSFLIDPSGNGGGTANDDLLLSSWVLSDQNHHHNNHSHLLSRDIGDEIVLKEEDSFSIQQEDQNSGDGEGLKDVANFFSLTDCTS